MKKIKAPDTIIINSRSGLVALFALLSRVFIEYKHFTIKITYSINRSNRQNALWAAMYNLIYEYGLFDSPGEAKKFCKLNLGVPLLCEYDPEFCQAWEKLAASLPYEQQLTLMGALAGHDYDGYPVTRLLDKQKLGVEYTDRVVRFFGDTTLTNNSVPVDFDYLIQNDRK